MKPSSTADRSDARTKGTGKDSENDRIDSEEEEQDSGDGGRAETTEAESTFLRIDGGGTFERRDLCAMAKVEVGDECPLMNIDEPIHEVNIQYRDGVCHVEALVGQDCATTVFAEHDMGPNCIGPVFQAAKCYPRVKTVEDDSLSVRLVLPDREVLTSIVDSIRQRDLDISIVQLADLNADAVGKQSVVCDLSILTGKERAALELAVERGYFQTPHTLKLEDLAKEFEITDSAFSYRLRSAQAKIINSLFSCCVSD